MGVVLCRRFERLTIEASGSAGGALLTELRHRAIDARMSLSAWISSVLEEHLHRDQSYEQARNRALKRHEQGLPLGGEPLLRDQAHAR